MSFHFSLGTQLDYISQSPLQLVDWILTHRACAEVIYAMSEPSLLWNRDVLSLLYFFLDWLDADEREASGKWELHDKT